MLRPYDFATLPDLMAPDMALVFVGINPSTYSVERGHYFARRANRFWPAFSRSGLSAPVRAALGVQGVQALGPEHDAELLRFGFGFTDVIKRPSSNASSLTPRDFEEWVPHLESRLRHFRVRVACFHGLTGYRPFARIALGLGERAVKATALGPQPASFGDTRLFVVPNPSPANAHFTPADQAAWYDRLAEFLDQVLGPKTAVPSRSERCNFHDTAAELHGLR
jgi:TDG/mug DNA glycosylase family protein